MAKNSVVRHFSLYRPPNGAGATPAVYHAYFVIASNWQTPGSGIASIIALTEDTPVPPDQHLIVKTGGAAAAMEEAEARIAALSGNKGLKRLPPKP